MNEKETTEAWQTKPGDMNASIDRMMADLATIESLIRTTRSLVEGAEGRRKSSTFVTANPPLGEDHMSRPEAVNILCRMATSRKVDVNGVIALQMGVRSLLKRHFDRQRNWARRREQAANAAKGDLCHED